MARRARSGMRNPASAYGLLEVAKPVPMGQSDWPLRFDDAPPDLRNGFIPSLAFREDRADSGAPKSAYWTDSRAGQAGDVSG